MADAAQILAEENTYRPTHRFIRERWVITAQLELTSPAHFGSGEASQFTDMPLMQDESDGTPVIPGTSIAGALRNYLREIQSGYGRPLPVFPKAYQKIGSHQKAKEIFEQQQAAERDLYCTLLFGAFRGDDEGIQSPLVVADAYGKAADVELRDGVTIDAKTRTAEDKKKFDIELLSAGSTFDLRFELNIGVPEPEDADSDKKMKETALQNELQERRYQSLTALATALDGFKSNNGENGSGEITIGARKRRGYGECCVREWTVRRYNLTESTGLLTWLVSEREWSENESFKKFYSVQKKKHRSIFEAINAFNLSKKPIEIIADKRQHVNLTANFSIDGSLLIRSGLGESHKGPDTMHLHSLRDNKPSPVISGTSWAGVLRHRAAMIARTMATNDKKASDFITQMFGDPPPENRDAGKYVRASRLTAKETVVDQPEKEALVQTRVKIDRFTGGAFETALFSEEPLWGVEDHKENNKTKQSGTRIKLDLSLRPPSPEDPFDPIPPTVPGAEIGLLLLLLKDLWTGDLPIGGGASIGRGRLRGKSATLTLADGTKWQLRATGDYGVTVETGEQKALEDFVTAFNTEITT